MTIAGRRIMKVGPSMRTATLIGVLLLSRVCISQSKPPSSSRSAPDPQVLVSQRTANQILAKLLGVVDSSTLGGLRYSTWPPTIHVFAKGEKISGNAIGDYNAFATAPGCTPKIGVTQGLIAEMLERQPDRLAFVLGHELSHLLLGHVECHGSTPKSSFVSAAYTRAQEFAADKSGFVLAMKAGYSNRSALEAFRIMDQRMGYSSFEALGVDHPSFKDRIAQLDEQQAVLWRSMSAFQNGSYFLAMQEYGPAEDCFERVINEFPDSYEAWLNLGYARLMQYIDNLSEDNVRAYGIGQLAVGGFYVRPASLAAKLRGIDRELWNSAVDAMGEAGRLKPDSALVEEDLGVAYLVHPGGSPQLEQAIPHLERAASLAQTEVLPTASLVSVAVNLAVAYASSSRMVDASRQLTEAVKQYSALNEDPESQYFVVTSLSYNLAALAAADDSKSVERAAEEFERYLRLTNRSSAWWPIAHERYLELCRNAGLEPKGEQYLESTAQLLHRPIISVQLTATKRVTLGDAFSDVKDRLGSGNDVAVTKGFRQFSYPKFGLSLLGDQQVLAIVLHGGNAPRISMRAFGVGQRETFLHSGMPIAELATALKGQRFGTVPFIDVNSRIIYFPDVGLAIDSADNQTVDHLILAQIPVQ
jgi:tetratricopeptide (TPR) repeat protein